MTRELTKEERLWINKAKKLFKNKPITVQVYCLDDSLIVCKEGLSTNDYSETLSYGIEATNMIHDIRKEG